MFEDSLMESGHRIKTKQGRYTALSTTLVVSVIGILILIPLLVTEALPLHAINAFLVAPPPPPPPPPPPTPTVKVQKVSEIVDGQLRAPSKIPKKIEMIKEEETPPNTGVMGGVVGGVPGGSSSGVIGGIIGTAPPPKVATPQKLRVSQGVMEGNLVRRIEPVYPQMAKIAHITGDVILQATISKAGAIENLRAVQGHPILIQAALDAVRQWKY